MTAGAASSSSSASPYPARGVHCTCQAPMEAIWAADQLAQPWLSQRSLVIDAGTGKEWSCWMSNSAWCFVGPCLVYQRLHGVGSRGRDAVAASASSRRCYDVFACGPGKQERVWDTAATEQSVNVLVCSSRRASCPAYRSHDQGTLQRRIICNHIRPHHGSHYYQGAQ